MTLDEIVALARTSRFYGSLYEHVPQGQVSLEELPIATFENVMAAVHKDHRALVTAGAYGMCYTTSGTTGRPKATLFGRDEWRVAHKVLAETHARTGAIRDGDVICSVSEPGSASFMAIHRVVDNFPGRCSEIPIGCDVGYPSVIRAMRQFDATAVAGMNPTILGLADAVLRSDGPNPNIRMLLGGGELFYGAQLAVIRRAFPNAGYCAFMYGATEAGLIGCGAPDLAHDQVRVIDQLCRVELIDSQTSTVIGGPGHIGRVLVTSFVRTAAPALRLETGDLAMWHDPPLSPAPRLSLHGRAFPFRLDVDGAALCEDDVWTIVRQLAQRVPLLKLQLVLGRTHELLIALDGRGLEPGEEALVTSMFAGLGLAVKISRVELAIFEDASRRKSRLIVDRRQGGEHG